MASEIDDAWRPLADRLMAAGVAEPVVGMDIPDASGGAWAEAELCWEEERVALTTREACHRVRGSPAPDWVVLYFEDLGESPEPVIEALHRSV